MLWSPSGCIVALRRHRPVWRLPLACGRVARAIRLDLLRRAEGAGRGSVGPGERLDRRRRGGSFIGAMATAIRRMGHEDRLRLVDRLDELRSRLIISAAALAVAFGFCLWQNHALLDVINKPLTSQTQKQVAKGQGTVGQAVLAQQAALTISRETQAVLGVLTTPGSGLSAQARAQLQPLMSSLKADVAKIPRKPRG